MNEKKMNIQAAIEEMGKRFQEAMEKASKDGNVEQVVGNCDEASNDAKCAFFKCLEEVSRITGITNLTGNILRVYEKRCSEDSTAASLIAMAQECSAIIDMNIGICRDMFLCDSAEALKLLVGKGSIFQMFSGTVSWIAGCAYRKFKKLGIHINEDTVLGAICKGIKGFSHIVLGGAKVLLKGARLVVSFAGAGVLMAAGYVIDGIKWLWGKIKGMFKKNEMEIPTEPCGDSPNGACTCMECDADGVDCPYECKTNPHGPKAGCKVCPYAGTDKCSWKEDLD